MDTSEKLFYWFLGLFAVSLFALMIADRMTSQVRSLGTVTVIDKSFVPSTTSSGIGFSAGSSDSGPSPVFVSSSSPEEFSLLLKGSGDAFTMKVSRDMYADVRIGEQLQQMTRFGGITGWQGRDWVQREVE